MTLGWGLVNQLVAPLVSVSGTHFLHPPLPCPGYTFGIPLQGDPFRSTPPQSELDAGDTLRRGIRPRGISIESLILFVHVGGI